MTDFRGWLKTTGALQFLKAIFFSVTLFVVGGYFWGWPGLLMASVIFAVVVSWVRLLAILLQERIAALEADAGQQEAG